MIDKGDTESLLRKACFINYITVDVLQMLLQLCFLLTSPAKHFQVHLIPAQRPGELIDIFNSQSVSLCHAWAEWELEMLSLLVWKKSDALKLCWRLESSSKSLWKKRESTLSSVLIVFCISICCPSTKIEKFSVFFHNLFSFQYIFVWFHRRKIVNASSSQSDTNTRWRWK